MSQVPVAECAVHTHNADSECEYCAKELEDLQAAYEDQVGTNQALEEQIARNGASLNAMTFFTMRLDLIMSIITNGDPKLRLRIEHNFATAMEQHLMDANQEAIRAKLTNGAVGQRVPKL